MTSESVEDAGIYDDFPGYRLPSEPESEAALRSALVVVDANVLLNLYRYNESTRDDLLGVLRRIGDRLWLPNQVLREFWRNRLGVLTSRGASTNQALAALGKQQQASSDAIRHWAKSVAINTQYQHQLLRKVDALYEELHQEVRAHAPAAAEFLGGGESEPVLKRLEELVQGKVGRTPAESEWQAAVKEGNERAARHEPPGYLDAEKRDSELPEGAAGDYLVWIQATEEAARRNSDLLLVTGDEKEDWWWRHRSGFLGPHVKLVAEFRARCGRQLYMMRPIDLLKRAPALHVIVRSESVKDVERVSREGPPTTRHGRDEQSWEQILDTALAFLIECAQQGRITTYSELNSSLQNRTGLPGFDFTHAADRAAMGYLLGMTVERNRPETNLMISALVTYLNSNDAGSGFYKLAQNLGLLSPDASAQMRFEFWIGQVKGLHEYYAPSSNAEPI